MPLVRKPTQPAARPQASHAHVLTGLASASREERWAAARAAAGLPETAAALSAALGQESDSSIREAMLTSLVRIGTRDSLARVLPLLRSDDSALRTGALDALRASPAAAHELLPQLLSDPDVDVRILSCELARNLSSQEASRSLCTLLAGEHDLNVCAAAIEVLAEVGDQAALPALEQCSRRFPQAAFLRFAVRTATDRIKAAGDRG